jgi:hypothetical protein
MNILDPRSRGAAATSISPVTARDPSSRRGVAPGALFSQQPQNGFALSIGETRIVKAPTKQRRILPVDEFVHH